jgi:hypothetical protein
VSVDLVDGSDVASQRDCLADDFCALTRFRTWPQRDCLADDFLLSAATHVLFVDSDVMCGDDLSSKLLSFEKDGALLRQRSGGLLSESLVPTTSISSGKSSITIFIAERATPPPGNFRAAQRVPQRPIAKT